VPLLKDPALDWAPVWSPDGRFIYFASDRGIAMNLWRIPVEQSSGRALGPPEPVTAGVQAATALPRFSKDGSRLTFRSRIASVNPVAIPFDPVTLRAGQPVILDDRTFVRVPSGVSPDGTQVTFFSIGEQREDIYIGSRDGAMRRITDDEARDRAPVFMPDGRSLVFYSNRDGKWAVWMVGVDGGGLRKVSGPPEGAVYANVSPKGDAVMFMGDSGRTMYQAPIEPAPSAALEMPGIVVDGAFFSPTSWSADGARLAGVLSSPSGRPSGIAIYDLASRMARRIAGDEAFAAKWLSDSRRLVFFANEGSALTVADTVTGARTGVDVRLPGPAINEMFAIAPDDRTIYYGATRSEADIWIVERR
jgi:Tol biopolymer transport system component